MTARRLLFPVENRSRTNSPTDVIGILPARLRTYMLRYRSKYDTIYVCVCVCVRLMEY